MSIQEDIQKSIADNQLYAIGAFIFSDWKNAFDTCTMLAKQGDVKAQFNLGYIYARGDIMERDFAKAYEWYEKAADNNDPRAHYNLAQMYENGEFVLPNNIKAEEHLARAVELGDTRAINRTAFANAKSALKQGDREKAKSLFASIAEHNKEAEMGVIACSASFKSIYTISTVYSYHSSGSTNNKKFWKWGESIKTEVDLTMSNQSTHSWPVLVKALIRSADGFVNISTIGDALKAGATQSNIIDPKDFIGSNICGVAVYSDREGSIDKPIYSFYFPDITIQPDATETRSLPDRIQVAQDEMDQHNKTAKPGACFVLTACYGSHDAPTVLTFRQFRDKHLSQYKLGRRFISWYYTHGPKWANTIEDKPWTKSIFRALFNQLAKVLPK